MTNYCCESTARDYFVDFIVDATGNPGMRGMHEEQFRTIVGRCLKGGFARILSIEQFLQKRTQ